MILNVSGRGDKDMEIAVALCLSGLAASAHHSGIEIFAPNRARGSRSCRANGELGIVAYITAGDPSLEASEKIVLAAAEAGADVIELGVPFSDPGC